MKEIRPRISQEEYEIIQDYRTRHTGLAKECETVGIDVSDVKSYWYKGKNYSINTKGAEQGWVKSVVEELVKKYVPHSPKPFKPTKTTSQKALKATLTDMHVGLEPNPDGNSLFEYEYNEEIFNENLGKVYNSVIHAYNAHGKFDLFLMDDLGDGLDGWDGETTRGGHKLSQNMGNPDMFRAYVEGKLRLIENFIEANIANKIIVRNVSNCNHSGDFGEIANMAIQMILDRTYDKKNVEFCILGRFMEHFTYGDHAFILTHGKDSKHMKRGLPLNLDPKTINFINDYIDHYDIRSKYIHVEKGDLHQVAYQRTKKFDYRNYMSFAPPSSWVMANFGDTYSGYSIQVIPKFSNEIAHTDHFFELKKK